MEAVCHASYVQPYVAAHECFVVIMSTNVYGVAKRNRVDGLQRGNQF